MPRVTYRPATISHDPTFGTPGTIVGGDLALETRDGDTSYIQVSRQNAGIGGEENTTLSIIFEPVGSPFPAGGIPTRVSLDAEWRMPEESTTASVLMYFAAFRSDFWGTVTSLSGSPPGYVWVEDQTVIDIPDGYTFDAAWVEDLFDPYWRVFSSVPGTGLRAVSRLTYLRVHVDYEGGLIPLRWRNRNDGLSGGPMQARGVSSQQMSNRHRGYL